MKKDQFNDYIQEELAWRKHEISQLMLMLNNNNKSTEVIAKSIILLLYAHWEGFIKKSCKLYIKYVSEQKVKISDLTINFHAIVLQSFARRCIESDAQNLQQELHFLKKQEKMLGKKFKIKVDVDNDFDEDIIDTKHNLSSKVLKNIIEVIGVKYNDAIKARENYINKNLLANRHAIGHGSKLDDETLQDGALEIEKIEKLKNFAVTMLDYFANVLMDYVENEFFLVTRVKERNEYENMKEDELRKRLEKF